MTSTEAAERRLREALAQRADRTEPADDALDRIVAATGGAGRRGRRGRSAGLLAAAAVLLVVLAVAVAVSRPGAEKVDTTDDPDPTTTMTSTATSEPPPTTAPSTTAPETTTPPDPATTTSTPTTTTPPTTTATPPPTTAPPPTLPGAATDPVSGSGTGDGIANLADVRVGADEGYDRVVIELHDGRLPDWSVSYVDPPIRQDGSGEPVAVGGDAFLLVRMTPASGYTVEGETSRPTYPGPNRIPGPGNQVVEVAQVGDYEAVATWAIGLRTRAPFRATTLTSPARIVIDIAT